MIFYFFFRFPIFYIFFCIIQLLFIIFYNYYLSFISNRLTKIHFPFLTHYCLKQKIMINYNKIMILFEIFIKREKLKKKP